MDAPKVMAGVGLAATAAVIYVTPFVASFEGLWLTAKPDRLAYNIPTACYGETEGIKIGQKFTKSQCMKMLEQKLPRYEREIDRCIKVPLPVKVKAMAISLSYNIGTHAFCHSTALKKFNAGDLRGGCNAFLSWTRAGGKYVPGLMNRRRKEQAICLEGIDKPTTTEPLIVPGAKDTVTVKLGPLTAPKPPVNKPWWKFGS